MEISGAVINEVLRRTDTGRRFIPAGNGLFKRIDVRGDPRFAFDGKRGLAGDEGDDDPTSAQLLAYLKDNMSPIAHDAFLKKMAKDGLTFTRVAKDGAGADVDPPAKSMLEPRDANIGGLNGVRDALSADQKLAFDHLVRQARLRMPTPADNTKAFAERYPDALRIRSLG
jgi:hypothetical protein